MEFKLWFEIADALDRPINNIEFQQQDQDILSYKFYVHNEKYEVTFTKDSIYFQGVDIPNFWSISLKGQNQYQPTNLNKGMHIVYSNLITAVNKLLKEHTVNAIGFVAAANEQELIYHKFYKKFLSQEFVQVGQTTFIKRDLLKEIIKKQSNFKKKAFYSDMLANYRDKLKYNKTVKKEKELARRNIILVQKFINQVVEIENTWNQKFICYITRCLNRKVYYFQPSNGDINLGDIPVGNIKNISLADPNTQKSVKDTLKSNPFYAAFVK